MKKMTSIPTPLLYKGGAQLKKVTVTTVSPPLS